MIGARRILVPFDDIEDRPLILRSSGFYHVFHSAAGEKSFPHPRVLENIKQIRGVAPVIGRRSAAKLRYEMTVRQPPVSMILLRIIRSQGCRDGFTDGVMNVQPVPLGLHEGKRPNPFLGVLWRWIREQ